MTDDQGLRTALLAIVLVVFPIGIYYRIRSQATGEPLDRRQEGLFILATLRPAGLLLWLGVIAYMPFALDLPTAREEPDRYSGHAPRAHAGHEWSLSLCPTSLLRLGRVVRVGHVARRRELVSVCDRRFVRWSRDDPNSD